MPEYLAPGVYVEEIEMGAKPIEGVSTSTAGFLGPTERGPTRPTFITSFPEYQRKFGGYIEGSNLAYGVAGFFKEGGQRCFVGRIVGTKPDSGTRQVVPASAAGKITKTVDEAETDLIGVTAVGPGNWGNKVAVIVTDATLTKKNEKLFKVTIKYWKGFVEGEESETDDAIVEKQNSEDIIEEFDNLSPDESSSDFYEKIINGASDLVELVKKGDGRPENTTILLKGGDEGGLQTSDFNGSATAGPGEKTGLLAFEEVDEIAIVCVPDENAHNVTGDLITHCEKMKDRFAICSAPQSVDPLSDSVPPKDSKYAAYYYPWIKILDPVTNAKKLVPPAGHIAGVYARSDTERGVHKAPANYTLRSVVEVQVPVKKALQDMLNPKGVNCIRAFAGRGIRVWGARTMSSDPLWKYVNVRRLFLFLEESIDEGSQWVVFEPNSERLWGRVIQSVTGFLKTVWKSGALMGLTPEEAFFVKCDRTTMTQNDIDNGRLIIVIGVAPVKPAEFVIFRIAQWTAGAS